MERLLANTPDLQELAREDSWTDVDEDDGEMEPIPHDKNWHGSIEVASKLEIGHPFSNQCCGYWLWITGYGYCHEFDPF